MTEIMPVPRNLSFTVLPAESLTAEAFLWWGIQGPSTHGLMNSPLDCSLPRSRSAVLSSPGWPFYKKSFHLTAEAFLWWAIQDLNPGPSGYEKASLAKISKLP